MKPGDEVYTYYNGEEVWGLVERVASDILIINNLIPVKYLDSEETFPTIPKNQEVIVSMKDRERWRKEGEEFEKKTGVSMDNFLFYTIGILLIVFITNR